MLAIWAALGLGFDEPPAPFAAAEFRRHVAFLADDARQGRRLGTSGNRAGADYMKSELEKIGAKPLGDSWFQDFKVGSAAARNVLGVFPGAGPLASQAVLVSAHHDHIGALPADAKNPARDVVNNGADDNASGCAGLLLIAAAAALEPAPPASRRTLILASFDGEESGLLGSRHYCQEPRWPLDNTAANVNFDMIGRLSNQRVYAFDCRSNPLLLAAAEDAGKRLGLRLETRLGGTARADHESFLAREIPAVHFSTGLHRDYHRVSDETDKCDHAGGARVAQLAYATVRAALVAPQRLAFAAAAGQIRVNDVLGLLLKLGMVPDTNAQDGQRPRINMVMPFSIASRRGLRAGDELDTVNGQGFERAEDAAVLFGTLDLHRDLKLGIRRAGQPQELLFPAADFAAFSGPAVEKLPGGKFRVRFRFVPPKDATNAKWCVTGSFNDWNVAEHPFGPADATGFRTVALELPAGRVEYKFVADGGDRWLADPSNPKAIGEHGNSLLELAP